MCNHPPKKRRPDELMDDLTEAIKFDDYGKMFDNDKLKPIININSSIGCCKWNAYVYVDKELYQLYIGKYNF